MTKLRGGIRQNNSLAGWLFADLSIVLTLIFMSSRLQFSSSGGGESITTTNTTTTLATPGIDSTPYGVSVAPKEIIVRISDSGDPTQIFKEIEAELRNQGIPENMKFGVVLIYAGPTEKSLDALKEADKRSKKIEESLQSWGRLTDKRWVGGKQHDSSLNYPYVKFKLLEDLSNP